MNPRPGSLAWQLVNLPIGNSLVVTSRSRAAQALNRARYAGVIVTTRKVDGGHIVTRLAERHVKVKRVKLQSRYGLIRKAALKLIAPRPSFTIPAVAHQLAPMFPRSSHEALKANVGQVVARLRGLGVIRLERRGRGTYPAEFRQCSASPQRTAKPRHGVLIPGAGQSSRKPAQTILGGFVAMRDVPLRPSPRA